MAHFYVYETVDLPIRINKEGVLDDYKHIVVSITQGKTRIDKFEDEIGIDTENNTINVHLEQTETALFTPDTKAKVQVNIYYTNTERDVTGIASIDVKKNLYERVINDE